MVAGKGRDGERVDDLDVPFYVSWDSCVLWAVHSEA